MSDLPTSAVTKLLDQQGIAYDWVEIPLSEDKKTSA
jgi:hypothetical protein